MKILLSSASFNADYGGPSLSVSRLGAALIGKGHEVALWAQDGSATISNVIPKNSGLELLDGPANSAIEQFGFPDILHDSGVWLPHNHALASYCRSRGLPRIVSPRGMLEPWAIKYKPLKKKIAWSLYQKRDLDTAAALHATSDAEADHFLKLRLTSHISIVPNGVDIPSVTELSVIRKAIPRLADGVRSVLFLGRLHPKKGLPMLIDAWSVLRPGGWRLQIAGPSEEGHERTLRQKVERAGLTNTITFLGPQYGIDKTKLLAASDLFVLPTYSENFGIAIAEALAHQVPVLTTTGTPWKALEVESAGWWVPPETGSIQAALETALRTPQSDLLEMGRRGRSLVLRTYGWNNIADQMIEFYQSVVDG